MAALGAVGVAFVALFVVFVIAVLVALLQWLWNITMPDVFGLNEITFWQAFRLMLIASILFGGPGAAASG